MEKETLHYRTSLRPFHFKTWGNIMVIPPKSCTSELKYQQDTIEEISFCLLTNYGSQHVVHACFNMLCFNMCFQHVFFHNLYCTFIALIFPFSQMISSLWSALLMMFVLCTRSFTDVMWCNVHPSLLLCVETDRCGDCLRMHTQLHCTQ